MTGRDEGSRQGAGDGAGGEDPGSARDARSRRLSAALRRNLQRRKAQLRARDAMTGSRAPDADLESGPAADGEGPVSDGGA
jgi:hypothetical protein